jgi:L-galactono-1,4-lactone dehydrogenase
MVVMAAYTVGWGKSIEINSLYIFEFPHPIDLMIFRVIMYLPSDDEQERKDITNRFRGQYCDLVREVGAPFGIVSHWGKLEMPTSGENFLKLRRLMASRYPLEAFNAARLYYDPKNILGNNLINTILGEPK